MARISEIRKAIQAALPEDVRPHSEVATGKPNYSQAMGSGLDAVALTVRVAVGPPDSEEVQDRLDDLLEPTGLAAAIEADRSLGGLVADVRVKGASGWRTWEHRSKEGAEPVLGAEWQVEVTAT